MGLARFFSDLGGTMQSTFCVGGPTGAPVATVLPWTDVNAGSTVVASLSQPNLSCDSSGAATSITLPTASQMASSDGFPFVIKVTGAMVSPVIVTAGAGTTVELLSAPGTFGASTSLATAGTGVTFKYDVATTTWKLTSQGQSGQSVTWASDLASSSGSAQWVSAISGANGTGATCALRSGVTIAQTQGGTLLAPNAETPLSFQPRNPAKAPFQVRYSTAFFNGTDDNCFSIGYNSDQANVSEPTCSWVIESDFNNGASEVIECYWSLNTAGGANGVRPFFVSYNRATGQTNTVASYQLGGTFQLQDGGTPNLQFVKTGVTQIDAQDFTITGSATAGKNMGVSGRTLTLTATTSENGGLLLIASGVGNQTLMCSDTISFRDHSFAPIINLNCVAKTFLPQTAGAVAVGSVALPFASLACTTFDAGTTGLHTPAGGGISIATGGTFTLSAGQYAPGLIVLTGSLAGDATVVLPATVGATWIIDATGVTLNGHAVTLRANSQNWGTTIGITNLYRVTYGGAGKLYGVTLTP